MCVSFCVLVAWQTVNQIFGRSKQSGRWWGVCLPSGVGMALCESRTHITVCPKAINGPAANSARDGVLENDASEADLHIQHMVIVLFSLMNWTTSVSNCRPP